MTDNTLMPCPFCGDKEPYMEINNTAFAYNNYMHDHEPTYKLKCNKELCPSNDCSVSQEEAIELWNTRKISWTQEDYEDAARIIHDSYETIEWEEADEEGYKNSARRIARAVLDAVGTKE